MILLDTLSLGQRGFIAYIIVSIIIGGLWWFFRHSKGGMVDDGRGLFGFVAYSLLVALIIFLCFLVATFCTIIWNVLGRVN